MTVTVHVIDTETGVPLFIGRPSDDETEYVRITRNKGQPALLEVRCSDMSASVGSKRQSD